ncbi:glycosyltransferase [Prosthecomicrobium pneumaticum]|uniref:Glycosyltransferase involved in cell wall biosynthesis n=1 Tax=Prosthecomicrobium pneumaticum TaxID=81895 RepID=A0A7W9CUQ5_9HYPH|nr:glycosyltransferase [Prosthecomicrobium pneumaticum]MBB5751866.1 glycosyltransferase involved in cell wall biosynthesis [Prosthecomicrobium pneumaticum]
MPGPASVHFLASVRDPGAGPSYSVVGLAAALRRAGLDADIHSVAGWRDAGGGAGEGVSHPLGTGPMRRFCASPAMRRFAFDASHRPVVLHSHGLWLMPNRYPAEARRRAESKARLIHAPRGMLGAEALRISRRKKQLVWHWWQRAALAAADCLHATAPSEYEEIRAAGLRQPVAVIPNGIDLPERVRRQAGAGGVKEVLSLGRVHPKKGLDRLVRAWALVETEFPDWRLRIVGPAEEGHDEALRRLAAELGLTRVSIEGPAYGAEKQAALAGAALFALPTLNENFAMTVAEALAAEVPVIATKGAPWRGLVEERCGWWIDHGPEPLAATFRAAMALPEAERRAMGARGRAWMARDFSWARIAGEFEAVYRWMLEGGAPPDCVWFD